MTNNHSKFLIPILYLHLFTTLVFRSTPTTDAPYVCNQCNWSFTQQQITYHHQREGVSGRFQNPKLIISTVLFKLFPGLILVILAK